METTNEPELERALSDLYYARKIDDREVYFITSDKYNLDKPERITDEVLKSHVNTLVTEFDTYLLCRIEELTISKIEELKTIVKIHLNQNLKEVVDLFIRYASEHKLDLD